MDQGNYNASDKVQLLAETGNISKPQKSSGLARFSSSPVSDSSHSASSVDDDSESQSDSVSSRSSKRSIKGKSSLGQTRDDSPSGYFESAQWSADGTTVLTYTSTNQICGYVIPTDLLAPRPSPLSLHPQSILQVPEPANGFCPAPYFSLSESWTNQLLLSTRDHPIQLFYLFPPDRQENDTAGPRNNSPPISSYPLTASSRSETFLTASSLLWTHPGTHFYAATRNLIARYDISRPGSEPILRVKTIPSERHISKGGGVGMRGTISTMSSPSSSPSTLIAAGTFTRWVGLYDFGSSAGECVSTWSVASATTGIPGDDDDRSGTGITQTLWSPCGRYLLVSERRSTRGILVYDVRVTGTLLSRLVDPTSSPRSTNQRITSDVFPSATGFEVWSGTPDGGIRVWEDVGSVEGRHDASWGWDHGNGGDDVATSTVSSACLHPSGSVIASCSGSWGFGDGGPEEGPKRKRGLEDKKGGSGSDNTDDEETEGGKEENMTWMRRRNHGSSLRIWGIEGDGDDPGEEDDYERQRYDEDEAPAE